MSAFSTVARPLTLSHLIAAVLAGCGSDGDDGATGASAGRSPAHPQWMRTVERGGERSLQVPLIALNCPVGNGFRCDRIVFAFTLRLPAERLRAWVAGRPVKGLRTAPWGEDGPQKGITGLGWTGFVQPAGLSEPGGPLELEPAKPNYWAGTPPVRARVRIVAKLKSGETVGEIFPFVNLQAGYG